MEHKYVSQTSKHEIKRKDGKGEVKGQKVWTSYFYHIFKIQLSRIQKLFMELLYPLNSYV